MTKPFIDVLDERAERILNDPSAYFAEVREQARQEVKDEMQREDR
ncbi:hypothetical protein AB0876_31330 [Mycobacterium sp. NPDC049093]